MDAAEKLSRVSRRLARLEIEMSGVLDDVEEVRESLGTAAPSAIGRPITAQPHEKETKLTRMLRKAAQTGVGEIKIQRHDDGSATVTIDGGAKVRLSPLLAQLFAKLCVDTGNSDDELIGYSERSELEELLGGGVGKRLGRRALTVAVNRLRDELEAGKYDRWLVQTDAKRGYRVAVRRGAKVVILDDHQGSEGDASAQQLDVPEDSTAQVM